MTERAPKAYAMRLIPILVSFFAAIFLLVDTASSEVPGPESVPNPLSIATIDKIQSVIVGEFAATGDYQGRLTTPDGDIKIVETITDSYRLMNIKKSLSAPQLRKKQQRAALGDSYNLLFLDKDRKIVAAASFYFAPDFGAVLGLCPGAFEKNGRYYFSCLQQRVAGNWDPKIDYRAYVIPFDQAWHQAIGYAPAW
jgi:hypothetical protein